MLRLNLMILGCLSWLSPALGSLADAFDPPAGYYSTATGTGATLKSQLHNIIDDHTVLSYGSARANLQVTDQDPNDPDSILLAYNRVSLDLTNVGPASGIQGWDSGTSWNREHTWPRARGVGSSGADNSDLHQLRPSNPSVNSDRDNLNFGGAFGAQSFGRVTDKGQLVYYPGDADAGMIARQQFYMAVRYDGSDPDTTDLELATGDPGTSAGLGDLSRLIEWHFAAVPDDFERRRNDVVFDDYQGNRNPFVDRPEFAWSIFVDQFNDSQIGIAGGVAGSSGASTLDIDLGRVFVGSAVPAAQNVTLNKSGLDGTYYAVTASGDATSTLSGPLNAFLSSTTDSEVVTVGLDTSTATAGLRTGAVTIDNLDVTTGVAGSGASDGDDTISLSLTVLDHAAPSFNEFSEVLTLTHDFGAVTEGSLVADFDFDIFNLASNPAFTADLELTGIVGSGDTGRFSTSLVPLTGASAIIGGASSAATAMFLTDTVGAFSASYLLSLAD